MKTIKVKKTPKGILGWLWRRKAVKLEPDLQKVEGRTTLIFGVDHAAESVAALANIGRYVRIEYNPDESIWITTAAVSLHDAAGIHYGQQGVAIVNAVGLPECLKGIVIDPELGGRAIIKSVEPPTAQHIIEVLQHIEKHTTAILDEYRRFDAMGKYRKGAK